MHIYQRFLAGGVPEYLARYYWWAYLWRRSIWFFDHQPIINAILFWQYDKLLNKTLAHVERKQGAKLLQLTCVYGKLTPSLLHHTGNEVHVCDVAIGQLELARSKTTDVADRCLLARMNAESLGYADDSFDQVILFFLFHELPPEAMFDEGGGAVGALQAMSASPAEGERRIAPAIEKQQRLIPRSQRCLKRLHQRS